ncbi:MAG: hypothetical protein AAFO69_17835 [Bacteroidota bacterium]
MKQITIFLIILLSSYGFASAQRIETTKMPGSYKFSQDGKTVNMPQLKEIMASNVAATEYLKKAQSGNTFATVVAGIGGGFVGFPLGIALAGGKMSWGLFGTGVGIIALSIPIISKANKNTLKAVEVYNASLGNTSSHHYRPQLKFVTDHYGIGLAVSF